jgi:hypothetical protein
LFIESSLNLERFSDYSIFATPILNVDAVLGFRPITRVSPGYQTAQAKRANLRVINRPCRFIAPVSDRHPITAIQALEFSRIDDEFPGFKKIVLA